MVSPRSVHGVSIIAIRCPSACNSSKFPVSGNLVSPRLNVVSPDLIYEAYNSGKNIYRKRFNDVRLTEPIVRINFNSIVRGVLHSAYGSYKHALLASRRVRRCARGVLRLGTRGRDVDNVLGRVCSGTGGSKRRYPRYNAVRSGVILSGPISVMRHVSPLPRFGGMFCRITSASTVTIRRVKPVTRAVIRGGSRCFRGGLLMGDGLVRHLDRGLGSISCMINILEAVMAGSSSVSNSCRMGGDHLGGVLGAAVSRGGLGRSCGLATSRIHRELREVSSSSSFILNIGPRITEPR